MFDLYLKFADRTEAETALAGVGIAANEGVFPCDGIASDGTGYALDVVFGTGIIFSGGNPVPGYHINMIWRGDDIPEALAPFHNQPATPACVFA